MVLDEDAIFNVEFFDCEGCRGHNEERTYQKGTVFQCSLESPSVYLDLDGDGILRVNSSKCHEIDVANDDYDFYARDDIIWQG